MTQPLKTLYHDVMMPNYAPYDLLIQKGLGATLYDTDGKDYIDFAAGIGVNALGYQDRAWILAIEHQIEKCQHTSNLYYNEPSILLAKKLLDLTGFSRVFFSNSGCEANECAIKIARKYSYDLYGKHRSEIITLTNSFHGRTIATLAATGQCSMHPPFEPLPSGFRYVPAGDKDALKHAISSSTCAIMLECIQGEGGVNILSNEYLHYVQALAKEHHLLLIIDEVQTGIGRTGKLFAYEHYDIQPDIVTCAKGLGGGLPIGACLVQDSLKETLNLGSHGSTFGGNPVVCAGALAVLERIAQPAMLQKINAKGQLLHSILKPHSSIEKIDQLGLMMGITLKEKTASTILQKALENGVLVLTAKEKIRLLPPLTISEEELQVVAERLLNVL